MNTEHSDHESNDLDHASGDNGRSAADGDERPEAPESTEPERAPPPQRSGRFIAFIALLFSLAALAGAAWMWWQDQGAGEAEQTRLMTEIARLDGGDDELRLRIRELRDELDALASGDVTAEFRAMQQRMESDRAQFARLEQTIREQMALSRSLQTATEAIQDRLQAAEAAVTGMSTRELDAGGELDLAEVDYLLRLANERLKLFADPVAADAALEVADQHLAALDNPMYLGVRQEIATARRALAGIDVPDYLALADRLDHVQERIPGLTFRGEAAAAAAPPETAESGWWAKAKSVFSSLVTVRRATEAEGRLSIEDKDYVRQRTWLQVEVAHLALMRRDEASFRNALDRVKESLSTWFEADDPTFESVMREIDALRAVDIEPDVPDITAPWSQLRVLRGDRPRPAAPPAAPEGASEPAAETPADGEAQG
ncbi:MAG: uroporphyrinogen-III C-methyltransferase [Xanthomonadales bacterium]